MPEPDALPTTDGGPARPWIALVGVPGHDLDALERALCTFGLSSLEAPRLRAVSSKALGALGRSWWDAPVSAAGAGSDGPPATLDQELEAFVAPARKAFLEAAGNARDRSRPAPAALLLADQVTASLLPLLLRAVGTPAGVVLVVTDPLEAARDLVCAGGFEQSRALAAWERHERAALSNLRGLPVFVTSRSSAIGDPAGWASSVGSFLLLHGAGPAERPSPARLEEVLGPSVGNDGAIKDEGLLLESQRQLASLLAQLVGPHEYFDPPAPEPESPWVTTVLDGRRDLEQLWGALEWATRQLASFLPALERDDGREAASEDYPLNASEDLAAYHRWLEQRGEPCTLPLSGGLPVARARVHAKAPPTLSVVVPVLRPPAWALERCVASVLAQSYHDFQLVLADDASRDGALEAQLHSFAHLDPRVELVLRDKTGGISAATNSAIEHARGEHVVFLDNDDELHPEALAKMAAAIAANPEADVLYSDEDKLSPSGERCVPSLKPDWSPDLLLSSAYFCHLLVVRRSLVSELGGLRSEFDGSQDYDLMLRATEVARAVVHVPEILYHWRVLAGSTSADPHAKPWAFEAERRALEDALARRDIAAAVEPHGRYVGNFHVRRAVAGEPLVSIIVPFRDEPEMTASCYRSLVRSPGYERLELLLVDNASELPETQALSGELAKDPRVRLVHDPQPFNWVAINNTAAAQARGDVLLFLNNDIEARSDGWLAAMLGHAQREEVGAVGALLRYPDLTVQHAGIVVGMTWGAGHVQQGLPFGRPSYMLMTDLTRDCTAVTGACMMTRRSCFEDLGGFDTALPVAFNDVDYCLRLRKKGLLVVYTPLAELIHHESKSRGHADDVVETPVFRNRWRDEMLRGDPYYNRDLTRFDPYCRLSTEEERDLWNIFRSMLEVSSTS
ncbi:MAG: glycosyltransferase family 2 protein [Acidimicrobiales bacterium]|jgi:GT2 family glycosyltransferase